MLFSCTWWFVKWNWCIEIVKGWYSVEEVFFVVLVEMRSSTYSVDILMYDIFWLSWFLESILPLFEPRGEIWLHLILNQERERRSWSGSARNLEFKNPSRGTYLLSFIPSFSQISPKFHKIWDEIDWKISSTWAWSIYGKLIHENLMGTSSVLANLENSSEAEELGQNFHGFRGIIRTVLEKSAKPTVSMDEFSKNWSGYLSRIIWYKNQIEMKFAWIDFPKIRIKNWNFQKNG